MRLTKKKNAQLSHDFFKAQFEYLNHVMNAKQAIRAAGIEVVVECAECVDE